MIKELSCRMIKERKMDVFEEYAVCPKCGATMKCEELSVSTQTQWTHKCTRCNYEETYSKAYPNIVYRRADD